jgi:hypothetical protein
MNNGEGISENSVVTSSTDHLITAATFRLIQSLICRGKQILAGMTVFRRRCDTY